MTTTFITALANQHIHGPGPCAVLSYQTGTLDYGIVDSANGVEMDHFAMTAAYGVLGRCISLGANSGTKIHDIQFDHCGTVAPPGGGLQSGVRFLNVTDTQIYNNTFTLDGPNGGDAKGYDILSDSGHSYRVRVTGNYIHGSNTINNIAMFNVDDALVDKNIVDQNNASDSSLGANAGQGYPIVFYGVGVETITSLARSTNVVTATMASTTAIVPGEHIMVSQVTSASGTDFTGDFYAVSASGTTVTWNQTAIDDTGTGGVINPTFQHDNATNNILSNSYGTCIYYQAIVDSVADDNVLTNCAQGMGDVSLPVGGIAMTAPSRITVYGGSINTSAKDGIVITASHDVTINGGSIYNITNSGIRFRGYNQRPTIKPDVIDGATTGILNDSTALILNPQVTGGIIRNTTTGVDLQGATLGTTCANGGFFGGLSITKSTTGFQTAAGCRYFTVGNVTVNGFDDNSTTKTVTTGFSIRGTGVQVKGAVATSTGQNGFLDFGVDTSFVGITSTNNSNDGIVLEGTRGRVIDSWIYSNNVTNIVLTAVGSSQWGNVTSTSNTTSSVATDIALAAGNIIVGDSNGIGAAIAQTVYTSEWTGAGSNAYSAVADQISGYGIVLHQAVTFSNIYILTNTGDGSNVVYGAAIAKTDGTAVCHTTTAKQLAASNNATTFACSEGAVTLPPGQYILLTTGHNTTGVAITSPAHIPLGFFYSTNVAGCTASSGVFSFASPCTISLTFPTDMAKGIPLFMLH